MKIVVEALCSEFGGIETYVRNLLTTWPTVFPDDEITALLPATVTSGYPGVSVRTCAVGRPTAIMRPARQTIELRRAVRETGADAVLATLPSTTVLHAGAPTLVVVYDLRHEIRPDQFPLARRVLRRVSYGRGYAVADGFASISQRSLDDLRRWHPRTAEVPSWVTHLGADHVDGWSAPASVPAPRPEQPYALAFAHHTNKRVDLAVEAWARLKQTGAAAPHLRIVGVPEGARPALLERINRSQLTDAVTLAPFLDQERFEQAIAAAALIVFPSDFEGFGLPVVEALRLGIPVVIGPEPALREVSAGHAVVAETFAADDIADAVLRAAVRTPVEREAGRVAVQSMTWTATVTATREALDGLVRAGLPKAGRRSLTR